MAGLMSASTLGIGIAAIIAGIASFNAFFGSNVPRYKDLPIGQTANIESGVAIGDAGESIVHTSDLQNMGGGEKVAKAIDKMSNELKQMHNTIKNQRLTTSVSNKDLNIVMTPQNA